LQWNYYEKKQPFYICTGFYQYKNLFSAGLDELLHIMQGCMDNDPKCQKMLYDRYLPYALRISYRYVHSFENAAHAANDAFVKIFKNFKKFEIRDYEHVESMLLGWIRRIVINASIDFMGRENLVSTNGTVLLEHHENTGVNNNGEGSIVYKELISLIKKLSPAYKVVFNLYVIDGYTHQEIANMLGISVGTSKSNLSKARAFLQKYLVKDDKGNILCFT
jgi:RNA polymerase sigma factor (sigma-70 family)